jgi:uncharacterized delta-60 repeat protein
MTTNRDGTLDRSFGDGGLAVNQANIQIFQSIDSVLVPDGHVFQAHIVSVGPNHAAVLVTKQLVNGDPDPAFGQNGAKVVAVAADCYASTLTIQPDGKILVGGYIDTHNATTAYDFFVLRLTTIGDLDQTFGNGGVFSRDYSPSGQKITSYDRVGSLLIQPDGKIIVAGMSDHYVTVPGRTNAYSVLSRLDSNGNLDTSFGSDGTSMVLIGNNRTNYFDGVQPVNIKFQHDGKFIAGATVDKESQISPGTYAAHAVVLRYLPNGSLDTDFSDDGMLDISLAYSPTYPTYFLNVQELSNGNILALSSDGLLRLDAAGTLDTTFGDAGRVFLGTDWSASNFEVTPDNKIVVSGLFLRHLDPTGTRFVGRLQRYWPDGSRDIRFGQGGKTTVEISDHNIVFGRITVFQGKYLIVFGIRDMTTFPRPFVARFFASKKL